MSGIIQKNIAEILEEVKADNPLDFTHDDQPPEADRMVPIKQAETQTDTFNNVVKNTEKPLEAEFNVYTIPT